MLTSLSSVVIRLVEEADFRAARELFGDTGTKSLEAILPKSVKDFEEYAQLLAARYGEGAVDPLAVR